MIRNRIMKSQVLLFAAVMLCIPTLTVMAGGQAEKRAKLDSTEDLKEYAGATVLPAPEQESVEWPAEEAELSESGPITLTVDRAVKVAMNNNLQLKSSLIDTRIKEREADYAWNRFIPSVEVSGTMGRMNAEQEQLSFNEMNMPEMEKAPQWSVSAGLDMSLTLNLAMINGIRGTQLDYQAGRISLEQARQQVERDVKKSFYNLLLMQENRALMVENIDAAERRYEQAQINYENGLVPELTVLNAQVAYENLKPQLKSIDLGYRQAIQGFKMTLGISLDREIELDGSIDAEPVAVDAEQLIDEHLADRLDIQSMLNAITGLNNQVEATKLQAFTPNLILGYNLDPSFSGDPWSDPWFDDISNDWSQRSGMFRLTIAMSLDSLLPFSQTQVGLRELEDNLQKTRIGLMQSIEGAQLEIESTVQQLEKSRDTIDTLQLNVERARRAYEMAEEAYNAGSQELLEVQNAEIELKEARLEVLKEKYTYLSALIDLEYQLNTNIERIIEE
ncbi:MAG: TolC family protein [Spirochaetia bacterium]